MTDFTLKWKETFHSRCSRVRSDRGKGPGDGLGEWTLCVFRAVVEVNLATTSKVSPPTFWVV